MGWESALLVAIVTIRGHGVLVFHRLQARWTLGRYHFQRDVWHESVASKRRSELPAKKHEVQS